MIQEYFDAAQIAANRYAELTGHDNITPELIYCQWSHETDNFTSDLCRDYNNLGGMTTETPNDLPQPDGELWYRKFDSPEDYGHYYGWYLSQFAENGIFDVTDIPSFAAALKDGGYFGDSIDNYVTGMTAAWEANFA